MTISNPLDAIRVQSLSYAYTHSRSGGQAVRDLDFVIPLGARVLLCGPNGAGKSTLLSILGGRRLIPRGKVLMLGGREAFHDCSLHTEVRYLGDWWRQDFFMAVSVRNLMGAERLANCEELRAILGVDLDWMINQLSDGQRRRCQLLDSLSAPGAKVLLLDEATADLDLLARQRLLTYCSKLSREQGVSVIYATHILDCMDDDWPTHVMFMAGGRLRQFSSTATCKRLIELRDELKGVSAIYRLIKEWMLETEHE